TFERARIGGDPGRIDRQRAFARDCANIGGAVGPRKQLGGLERPIRLAAFQNRASAGTCPPVSKTRLCPFSPKTAGKGSQAAAQPGGAAIGGEAAIAPITADLRRELVMQCKAAARQGFERRAVAPVQGKKAASLTRRRAGEPRSFDDGRGDTAAAEEISDGGADHAAAADQYTHRPPQEIARAAKFQQKRNPRPTGAGA